MMYTRVDLPEELAPRRREAQRWFLENFRPRLLSALHWNNDIPWDVPRRKILDNFFLFPADPILLGTEREERVAKPGEFFLVPEGRWHWYRGVAGTPRTAHVILHVLFDSRLHANPLDAFPTAIHPLGNYAFWYARLRRLVCLGQHSPEAARRHGEALLTELLLELIHDEADGMAIPEPRFDARIARAIEHVDEHLDSDLTVEDMAALAGLGLVRFRKLFKRHTGLAPRQYLVNARARKAAELLLGGHLKVAEVARLTGFSNEFYFSNAFKRSTGLSPSRFREREGRLTGK